MNLIDLIIKWENRAKRNFWDAEQVADPIEKRLYESRAHNYIGCAGELRGCLESPLLASSDIQLLNPRKKQRRA
jgi:hypothetical protein